ncbi:holin [Fictibacillus sp. NRS-1165]|uniref:holin n=1 Tax=Fictibacillus sp. NRS-1165 TaxID=3144463 RepID=UPI003D24DA84
MEHIVTFASLLTPLVTGLVQLLKRTFPIKKRFIPLISFFIGIIVGILAYPFTEMTVVLRLWSGGIAGLAATGLYELGKRSSGKASRKAG